MNIMKYTGAFLLAFSLVFAGQAESKQHRQNKTHSHSKGGHHKSTHKSQHKKNKHSTTKKVNHKAKQTFKNNKPQANISSNAMQHIKDRHWYNAQQGPNTSHFSHSMTDKKLNRLATKTINKGSQKPSTHGQGRSTHQLSFKKPIGTTTNGQKAHSLRVVTDSNNNVITAFPVK